jgi:hypothetical protein
MSKWQLFATNILMLVFYCRFLQTFHGVIFCPALCTQRNPNGIVSYCDQYNIKFHHISYAALKIPDSF